MHTPEYQQAMYHYTFMDMEKKFELREEMKFKKGNRWKTTAGKLRYKKWRTGVFKLNRGRLGLSKWYVCEKCSKKRKTTMSLHAHHIFSWDKFPDKRYTIKNGVVLCKWCHDGFHYKYKFDALEKPELMLDWVKDNKRIKEYINEWKSKK